MEDASKNIELEQKMTENRKLRRNDIKRTNIDETSAENAKLEKENVRYRNREKGNKTYPNSIENIKPLPEIASMENEKDKTRKKKIRNKKITNKSNKSYANMNRQERMQKRKIEFRKKAILIVTGCLLVAGLGVGMTWYLSFDNLNLADYVTISYEGYDSHGTAYPHINALGKYSNFLGMLNCQIKTDGNLENGALQNGDEICVDVEYDKTVASQMKLRVKNAEIETKVEGLAEGKELTAEELFDKVDVSYDGIAPEIVVTVMNQNTDEYLKNISFTIIDEKAYYDLGDEIQVKANVTPEELVKNGYAITDDTEDIINTYTIENVDRYIRDASSITTEQIKELNQAGSKLFGDAKEYGLRIFSEANLMPIWVNNKTTFQWSNPRLQAAYFNVLKEDFFGQNGVHDNDVKLVYNVTLSQTDGVSCNTQVVVRFTDLIEKADGTIDLSVDSGKIIAASYKRSNIKELVNDSYNQDYESTEIPLN